MTSTTIFERASRVALALALVSTFATPLHAQAEDEAAARALFGEARALMKTGDYGHACPKLEAARSLYAGPGILLNLGDCYEHVGRTASAWAMFSDAIAAAHRADRRSDDVEATATTRRNALDSKLTKLEIVADGASPITIIRDGRTISPGAWNVAIPVDPGPHTVVAEASGKRSWTKDVTTGEPGSTIRVVVPPLEPLESEVVHVTPPPPPPPPVVVVRPKIRPVERVEYWTGLRIGAATITSVGVVSLGVSGIVGFVARGNYEAAVNESGAARHNDSSAAYDLGNVGTVIAVASGVLAAGGLVLWLAAPGRHVRVGASGRGVVVGGAW